MRIAIAINTSWNIFNFRLGLIKALLAQGHEVYTIAPFDDYTDKLQAVGCSTHNIKLENTGLNPIKDISYYRQLKQIYQQIRPAVVLNYTIKPNIYGTLACYSLRIPVINNVSGLGTTFLWNPLLKSFVTALYKYSFSRASFIFFQNSDDRNLFLKEVRISEDITGLLPGSGIELDHFQPQSVSKNDSIFTFLLISRLLIDKGVGEFFEAAELLKAEGVDARFLVLGRKDPSHKRSYDLNKFERLIEDDVIEYIGTEDDVRPIISGVDCVVLPSYREGTPRTLLEAASMGKPLIATDVPGCREVVKDGVNGFLCQVKNASDLAEKMKLMFTANQNQLSAFGRASRTLVEEKYDVRFVIEKYIEKIENLTGKELRNSLNTQIL